MNEKNITTTNFLKEMNPKHEQLLATLRIASKKIAPVWPLENFVAVNPFMGLTNKSFENVAHDLAAAGGIQMTLPLSFYLEKIEEGKLKMEDLAAALHKKQLGIAPEAFIKALHDSEFSEEEILTVVTVADVASKATQQDWKRFVTARISAWAASYFDSGQAIWAAANQEQSVFLAWKEEATVDFTTELTGLQGFRSFVKSLPDHPLEAAHIALTQLGIPEKGIDSYLHGLLLQVGGWSAFAARLDWDSTLYGGKDGKLIEFLAVLICWEAALLHCIKHETLQTEWKAAAKSLGKAQGQKGITHVLTQKLILQEAFDIAAQRQLIEKFQKSQAAHKVSSTQAKAQAIFCIDVRSEVFRRNLELADNSIQTMGFAGFFAFPIKYVPIGHEHGEAQCPVLLKTGPTILEEIADKSEHDRALNGRILQHQFEQVWKSFKSGAVSCFSFVSPLGLSYLPKLFTDSFGFTRPVPHPDQAGLKSQVANHKRVSLTSETHHHETVGIPIEQQIQMAKNALNAMSLTDDFAKFVLIVGHGASMVNNLHATGYDCGACGGHSGEANAKVAAAVLNSKEVRAGLQKENIFIPINTVFLACLHDTTTDEVTIFNAYEVAAEDHQAFSELQKALTMAGQGARSERALKLNMSGSSDIHQSILARSKDWSQTRPEWGLAGCSAFVVAPRDRTQGLDFGGRSFLHSYDWKNDKGFGVLELIMTAPVVVTSWISLQYFASTVDNKVFGSGNKTLHNVTAGIGVLEGFSGDLRVGLPWQAVHDGENYQHEPVKLNVIIEAPIAAMNAILEKHQSLRDLFDNGWMHLMAMDQDGQISQRYTGALSWEAVSQKAA
jgi:uncharacterized protein